MVHQAAGFVRWGGLLGLMGILALTGCATKSTVATASGTEANSAVAKTGPGGGPSQPLTGFSKAPGEEQVRPSAPMAVAKAGQQEIAAGKVREKAEREVGDVYFAFDKWVLSSEGRKNLVKDAEVLKQNATAPILIEGYCDERGSREYNLVLGEKRAKETQQYLLGLGIRNPVKIISYGKERSVCTEHDESCYWKNRRAHLMIEDGR